MKFKGYVSRWEFILTKCRGKKVLHLGCIGETERSTSDKVKSLCEGKVLHAHLRKIVSDVVGVDYNEPTVRELNKLGFNEILCGNVEGLDEIDLQRTFDVILCGDLIEHLSESGKMFKGLRPRINENGELLIMRPNSFGLLHFFRYAFGRFREGNDHVLSFSIFTLQNLLRRYDLYICETYACYNRPAQDWKDRLRYTVGIPFFKLLPKFGGTLLVVARSRNDEPL